MTLSDLALKRETGRVTLVQRISVITHQPFGLERPNLSSQHLSETGVFLEGHTCPLPKGRNISMSKISWHPLHARTREKQ